MPIEFAVLTLSALFAVVAIRCLPKAYGSSAVGVITGVTLTWISWQSALWLTLGGGLTLGAMSVGNRFNRQTEAFICATLIHVLALFVLRDLPGYTWIGGAYFTLRHIHVMSDWWQGILKKPTWADYARYHFFVPVLAAGPIHRFPLFQQQLNRRRNDAQELFCGAERVLWGAFQCIVLGGWLLSRIEIIDPFKTQEGPLFVQDWAQSVLHWIGLYLTFAGLSSIAIGLALMMGLRIEENFNAPWRARSLVDFWSRWHMSLTNFSKDYIFRPVSALTMSSVAGAFSSMIFLGIWHGSSLYWLGWGLWQGLGILLTIQVQNRSLPWKFPSWSGKVFAALWLSLTFPVVSLVTGVTPQ